jgi:hypothetical protein
MGVIRKIGLTVDDGYGDTFNQTVKVKISRTKGSGGK